MSEMVERIANELERVVPGPGTHEEAVDLARAAIEAMREPTKGMIEAGAVAIDDALEETRDSYSTYVVTNGSDYARPGWQAMIDAALK